MRAILSKTTTDQIKSKQLSPELCQLVLDVYITPQEYASIIQNFYDKEFVIEFKSAK